MKKQILRLIKKPLLDINIKVEDILLVEEDNVKFLRIIIDKEPYIDIDDCVTATKLIDPIIDQLDIVEDSYILDVCSKEKGDR